MVSMDFAADFEIAMCAPLPTGFLQDLNGQQFAALATAVAVATSN
jgi:hypothetical protein